MVYSAENMFFRMWRLVWADSRHLYMYVDPNIRVLAGRKPKFGVEAGLRLVDSLWGCICLSRVVGPKLEISGTRRSIAAS